MVHGTALQFSPKVVFFEYIYQKIRKFINVSLYRAATVVNHGIGKQIVISVFYHACTGGRWRYNDLVVFKIMKELVSHLLGFIPKTGVVGWLSTAGLLRVVTNMATSLFQNTDGIERRFGKQLIDETRNKELNGHILN